MMSVERMGVLDDSAEEEKKNGGSPTAYIEHTRLHTDGETSMAEENLGISLESGRASELGLN